jgi:hypothetical protein
MSQTAVKTPSDRKAYIITGPTSGIGRVTAVFDALTTGLFTRSRKSRQDAEDH